MAQAQNWTLPATDFTDTMLIRNATPASTPYFDRFPSATHTQMIEISELTMFFGHYMYMRLTPDSLITLGVVMRQRVENVFDTAIVSMSVGDVVLLPVGLGLSLPVTVDTSYRDPSNYEVQTAQEVIDAFGTIVLPNGTYSCLRSKRTSHYDKYTNGVLDTFTLVRFHWITKEGHEASVTAAKNDEVTGTVNIVEVQLTKLVDVTTGVPEPALVSPDEFALAQNYPNPFNPTTSISYTLATPGYARLAVYSLLGAQVALLADGLQSAGTHTAVFNAAGLTSGVYYYRLTTADGIRIGKMNLVK